MNTAENKVTDLLGQTGNHSNNFAEKIKSRRSRELVIGLCGAIGSGVKSLKNTLKTSLESYGYEVVHIRISSIIAEKKGIVGIESTSGFKRYNVLQDAGDELREKYQSAILAACSIKEIAVRRQELFNKNEDTNEDVVKTESKVAYILDQLKHPAEVELLRAVYNHNFYLFGLIRTEKERRANLEDEKISPDEIDKLIRRDRKGTKNGQQVEKTFHGADFFIRNQHNQSQFLTAAVERCLKLIHGTNGVTPTNDEVGMFSAYTASLRSACLSRQVGASIMNEAGKVISSGCNDVPEFNGGLYNANSNKDFRCVHKGYCSNDKHKNLLKDEIVEILRENKTLKGKLKDKEYIELADIITSDTKISSIIEYSRAIHAEMDAIVSLARQTSESTVGKTLYSTTYPCHNCARHIVAAGISKVIYIEPYEKSLAMRLHQDAISEIDEADKVSFIPFEGVSPRRFEKFFRASSDRKDDTGKVIQTNINTAYHVDSQYLDSYHDYENKISSILTTQFLNDQP